MPSKIESPLITGDTEYDREQMKILLIRNGVTATEIARGMGIKSQSVSQVVNRRANSRRVLRELENLPVQV